MIDSLVNGIKGFVMAPSETFVKTREKSLGAAYQYYVALLVIFTVLLGIVMVTMGVVTFTTMISKLAVIPLIGGVMAGAAANFTGFIIALNVFLAYLIFLTLLIGIFIIGLVTHAFVLLLGGEKGVEQTVKTTMYASTPALLLGWIPYIGVLGFIWSLVLLILGIKENHGMDVGKASLVVLIPIILYILLIGLGSAVIIAFMGAFAGLIPKVLM
jgi:hypothetical protein